MLGDQPPNGKPPLALLPTFLDRACGGSKSHEFSGGSVKLQEQRFSRQGKRDTLKAGDGFDPEGTLRVGWGI